MFKDFFKAKATKNELPTVFLHNSASDKIETLSTIKPGEVLLYSCGPTVYDYAHIGNLRSYVFSDIVKRTLIFNGYSVRHTINLTDFGHLTDNGDAGEDKMMKGLKKAGLSFSLSSMRELSDTYIQAFYDDFEALHIMAPTTWSRASDYVKVQISLIETLEGKGYTYETSDGIYFDIEKYPAYGRLGNINLAELKNGARIEVNPEKHHPADFAVWKKGQLGWDSRWGKGFPGWHIECSAMAMATLGKSIDIHTGGIDHIPIHHNAEIAQSECATGKPFVKYWLHNAFITIDNTKISKSLGNTINLRHLFDRGYTGLDYRYWLLTAHYRSPVNFSWEALAAAKQALFRLRRFMYEELKQISGSPSTAYVSQLRTLISNDFDTPAVIALLWQLVKDDKIDKPTKCATILVFDSLLDIGLSAPLNEGVKNLGILEKTAIPKDVSDLVERREAARIARNWLEADTLRQALNLKGYVIEDTPHGPKLTKSE